MGRFTTFLPHPTCKKNTQASAPLVLRECYDSVGLPPPSCDENRRGHQQKATIIFIINNSYTSRVGFGNEIPQSPRKVDKKSTEYCISVNMREFWAFFADFLHQQWKKGPFHPSSRKTPSCWIFSILPALASQDDISCVFLECPLLRGCIASQIDNILEVTVWQTLMRRCIKVWGPLYDRFL